MPSKRQAVGLIRPSGSVSSPGSGSSELPLSIGALELVSPTGATGSSGSTGSCDSSVPGNGTGISTAESVSGVSDDASGAEASDEDSGAADSDDTSGAPGSDDVSGTGDSDDASDAESVSGVSEDVSGAADSEDDSVETVAGATGVESLGSEEADSSVAGVLEKEPDPTDDIEDDSPSVRVVEVVAGSPTPGIATSISGSDGDEDSVADDVEETSGPSVDGEESPVVVDEDSRPVEMDDDSPSTLVVELDSVISWASVTDDDPSSGDSDDGLMAGALVDGDSEDDSISEVGARDDAGDSVADGSEASVD